MKIFKLFILISLIPIIGMGQGQKEYQVGEIDNWTPFTVLTELEMKHHLINERSYKRRDSSYKSNKLYLPTVSEDKKKTMYEQELKQRVNYKENHSRYFVESLSNDSLVDKTYDLPYTLSTPCSCEINKDTLQINMGMCFFGGSFYKIKMYGKTYELTYIEDTHKIKAFKYTASDSTFVGEVVLSVRNADLQFSDQITFDLNQQLNGYLKFESPVYYEDTYLGENPDKQELNENFTRGKIYFTCTTRKPFVYD